MTSSALQSRKWQLIGMSQWCRSALCGHPLPALTDNNSEALWAAVSENITNYEMQLYAETPRRQRVFSRLDAHRTVKHRNRPTVNENAKCGTNTSSVSISLAQHKHQRHVRNFPTRSPVSCTREDIITSHTRSSAIAERPRDWVYL